MQRDQQYMVLTTNNTHKKSHFKLVAAGFVALTAAVVASLCLSGTAPSVSEGMMLYGDQAHGE